MLMENDNFLRYKLKKPPLHNTRGYILMHKGLDKKEYK